MPRSTQPAVYIERVGNVALPTTQGEMLARYRLKRRTTFNDHVQDIVLQLIGKPEFRKYIDAMYDFEAVEGKTSLDDVQASLMIRACAEEAQIVDVANAKLIEVMHALRVTLKRFGQGRRQRREEGLAAGSAMAE